MTAHSTTPPRQQVLRKHAEDSLKGDNATPSRGWLTSLDALSLLYKLASSPDSAGDALRLLHELQVYQVELDLQQEQLEASERQLTEDLIHCARLYDFAPVAYFSISQEGAINRVNVAGAALCGEERADLIGRRLEDLLLPDSRPALEKLVAQVRDGVLETTCEVQTISGEAFHVKAGSVPGESSLLMVFVELAESGKPARRN